MIVIHEVLCGDRLINFHSFPWVSHAWCRRPSHIRSIISVKIMSLVNTFGRLWGKLPCRMSLWMFYLCSMVFQTVEEIAQEQLKQKFNHDACNFSVWCEIVQ